MAKLIYTAIASVDGYVADADGNFDWSAPDDEVHAFINDLERPVGTYLLGRRMYEVMKYWDETHERVDQSAISRDFAQIWQAAEKIVYSRTIENVSARRTRLERAFLPEVVSQMKATSEHDLSIGGSQLAAVAFAAGLIDECRLFLTPAIIGGGKAALPRDQRISIELQDERLFRSGVVYVNYRVISAA